MAWTEIAWRRYRRDELRFASDASDAEWSLIEPLSPPSGDLSLNLSCNRNSISCV